MEATQEAGISSHLTKPKEQMCITPLATTSARFTI